MAKRKTVEIDESVILDMMSSDIPSYARGQSETDSSETPEEETPAVRAKSENIESAKPRRKREPKDYGTTFLAKRAPDQRKHTYISIELLSKIAKFLPVIANGITVPNFIDNVLSHHLEAYRDEINELYDQKTRKPL